MPVSLTFRPLSRHLALILGIALTLSLSLAASADFAADVKEPLRLLEAKKFAQALVALEKIAPQNKDQFALHYMMALARMGRINEKSKAADVIKNLQSARKNLLRAQQLVENDTQKKEAREMMAVIEEGLREMGVTVAQAAPEATAPQTEIEETVPAADRNAEIEELKRRLAELEAKPAPSKTTKPALAAKPAVAAKPATKNRVVPSKFPPTPRRAGYVTGRVLNSAGQPLAGAEISITGMSGSGENAKFAAVSGAGGLFSQRVPNGIYRVVAEWKTRYNNNNYKFDLHPDDGKDTVIHQSAPGIVKNFRWKITGLRPGQDAGKLNTFGESTKYYGGHISVSVQRNYNTPNGFVYFPQGSTLVMTLVPRTKLIDGSEGATLTYRHTLASNITYYEYLSWYIDDIPIGLYSASAQWVTADGTSQPLRLKNTKNIEDAFTLLAPINFEPGQFDNMQSMAISLEPVMVAAQ